MRSQHPIRSWLNGRITGEFFDQRSAEWCREQEGLMRKIQDIQKAAPVAIRQAIDTLRLPSQGSNLQSFG